MNVSTLRRATALAERIENMQTELAELLAGNGARGRKSACRIVKHRRTPAQRAAISEGLKRKWAERKAVTDSAPAVPQSSITPFA